MDSAYPARQTRGTRSGPRLQPENQAKLPPHISDHPAATKLDIISIAPAVVKSNPRFCLRQLICLVQLYVVYADLR